MSADLELCFRRLHASNILGIVTADEERITSANGAFLRMLGYTRADLRAGRLQWRKLTPPEFAAIDEKKFREIVRHGRCAPFEKDYFRKDGRRVPVLLGAARLAREPFACVCFVQDLSERKQAEAALRTSEARFRLFMDNSPTVAWVKDEAGRLVYISHAFEKRIGVRSADWIGRTDAELWPPQVAAEFRKNDLAVLAAGRPRQITEEIRNADGSASCWLSTKFPIRDGEGHRFVAGIGLEITDLKRTEEALRQSEAQFRAITELSPDIITIFDRHGHIKFNSAAARRIHGYGKRQLDERSTFDLIHPEDRAGVRKEFSRLLKNQADVVRVQYRYRGADGSYQWMEAVARNELANPHIKGIIAISRDIAEQKRFGDALRASEERYRWLAENAADFVSLHNVKGKCLYRSPSFYRATGWSEAEGDAITAQRRVHPADWPAVKAAWDACLRGKRQVLENRYLCKNGLWLWLETRWEPVLGPNRRVTHFIVTSHDITARKQAEEALRANQKRLEVLVQTAPAAIVIHGPDGRLLQCNALAEELLGLSIDRATGKTLRDRAWKFLREDGSGMPVAEYPVALVLRRKAPLKNYICGIQRRPDDLVWVLVNASPRFGANGALADVTVAFIDITERKRAEREREEFFKFFQISSDIMVIADPNGAFKKVNPATLTLLGYSEKELISKPFVDFVHPEDRQATLAEMARQIKRGASINFENRYLCKSGEVRRLSWRANYDRVDGITYATARDITARKRAEEELRAKQNQLEVLVETAPAAIVIHGPDGQLLRCNTVAAKLLGIAKTKAPGKALQDRAWRFLREDGTPMPVEEYPVSLVLRRRTALSNYLMGFTLLGKSEVIWALVNAQPRFGEDGALVDITVAFIDITARKQAQDDLRKLNDTLEQRVAERTAALRESEERFRGVVQDQTELICRFRADGTVLFVNEVFCRFFAKSSSDVIGQRWQPHALAEDLPRIQSELGKLTKKNPVVVIENRVYSGTGEVRWMQFVNRGFFDRQGRLLETQAVARDITERKQAETAMRDSEEKFRRLFGTVADAVLLFDAQTRRILEVNEAMLRMYGCSREQALRLTVVELSAQPEAAGEVLQRVVADFSEPNLRALHRKRDGTAFPVQISASTFEFQGRPLVCLVVRDITREVEMEKEILAISEREQQRIARDVHDDLCQHLTGIQFLAGTLAADLKDLDRPQSAGARKIAGLTRQALQKARHLSHGLAPVELEHGGLAVALRRLCLQVQPMFRCRCHFNCDPKVVLPPPATAIHLYRIVQEAVSNAVRHGRASRIDITIAARRRGWTLKIADNGLGLGKAKKTGPAKPGMGLRVMQYRAGMIGGTLSVRSRSRTGTEVICTLPNGALTLAPRKDR